MAKVLNELIIVLSNFVPGDLAGGIAIKERCEEYSVNEDFPTELRELLTEIADVLSGLIKHGFDEPHEKILKDKIKLLEEFGSLVESVDSAPNEEKVDEKKDRYLMIDDVEVLISFIQEAQEHLSNIEEKILNLEKSENKDTINDIFRSMHTIKGVSSFLGFNKIKLLGHLLESLLDGLRIGSIHVNAEVIDVLLEGTDGLAKMIHDLDEFSQTIVHKVGMVEVLDSTLDIEVLAKDIESVLKRNINKKTNTPKSNEMVLPEELITPEMIHKYVEESYDLLDNAERSILEIEKDPKNSSHIADAFRSVHTIKGNAGFFGFIKLESVSMNLETVMDSIRKGGKKADKSIVNILLESIDTMRSILAYINEHGKEKDSAHEDEDAEYKPLGDVLVDMGAATKDVVEKALDIQSRKLGEILVEEGNIAPEAVSKALAMQGKASGVDIDAKSYSIKRKDIRVDTEKLDRLFDLIGELIIAEAMLVDNPELSGLQLDHFNKAAGYLTKITREIQEITMAVRMIPLEGLFNKMRRLVRDLSRKFDKKINLHVSGQDTEMDRNVMEEISDPLVHIIRNAIDHGIENPKNRRQVGKDEIGSIYLNAKYEGNEIWITIRDDGAGLNSNKIVKSAIEKGIIDEDQSDMPENQKLQLIFEPGFSTAEKVSEISGRGVGMDVVKKNIDKLKGKIDIETERGKGTAFILRIPLTLAIIDAITVKVGRMLYSIAISDILEFQKISPNQVTQTNSHEEVVKLRDRLIPAVKLWEFFNLKSTNSSVEDGIVIVCSSRGRLICIVVDEIVGYRQLVIKALPEIFGDMKVISGCSIMGNGDVSLIIDIGSLIQETIE